jgi:hypothetical protein
MKKPRPLPAVALLLAALVTAVGLTTVEGEVRLARGREQAARLAVMPAFIPVRDEEDFRAALRADRAAVFLRNKLSVESTLSQRAVEAWVRQHRPPFPVFLAEPVDQPYVSRWMAESGMNKRYGYPARHGLLVWLRRGVIVAELPNPNSEPPARLPALTEEAFGTG